MNVMNDLSPYLYNIIESAMECATRPYLIICMITTLIVYFYNRNTKFFGVLMLLEALIYFAIVKDMQYTHMIAEILDKDEKLLLIRNALALCFFIVPPIIIIIIMVILYCKIRKFVNKEKE